MCIFQSEKRVPQRKKFEKHWFNGLNRVECRNLCWSIRIFMVMKFRTLGYVLDIPRKGKVHRSDGI